MSNNLDISELSIDRSGNSKGTSSTRGKRFLVLACLASAVVGLFAYMMHATSLVNAQENVVQQPIIKSSKDYNASPALIKDENMLVAENFASDAVVLDASGHIVARRIATVSSRVTGKLTQLHIEEGQRVSKAQVLAELDEQQARISYQLALADLSAQQASYQELEVVYQHEQKRLQRRLALKQQSLISEQLVDDTRFNCDKISAQLNNKQALIELSKQKLALAQYQLAQHKIRAPFDGVVISKNAQVGELISAGTSGGGFIRTGVGTLVDMSSLEIEVDVSESYINRVRQGQQATAVLDAYPQWRIPSEVVAVIPTADRQKASVKVRIKLLEINEKILPDMGVKVSFLSHSAKQNSNS